MRQMFARALPTIKPVLPFLRSWKTIEDARWPTKHLRRQCAPLHGFIQKTQIILTRFIHPCTARFQSMAKCTVTMDLVHPMSDFQCCVRRVRSAQGRNAGAVTCPTREIQGTQMLEMFSAKERLAVKKALAKMCCHRR